MKPKQGRSAPPSPGMKRKRPEDGKKPAQPDHKKPKHAGKAAPAAAGGHAPKPGKPSKQEDLKQKTSSEKRATIREKKLALKKNWNVIQDSVYLWEKLRPKEVPDEERKQLVSDILKKVKGKLLELCNHHTASRVLQFCVQYGTPEERKRITDEVRANIVELAKSKYGHFLVRKLINKAPKEDIPALVRLFRGHIAPLLRQPYGADVVTDLYDVASTAQRNEMCAEFYGKEFVLFDGIGGEASRLSSLKQLMEGAAPAKQRAVVLHMSKALQPILEKALLHPPLTHRLVRDFLECAPSLSVEDAVDTLTQTGSAVLKMVHTHEGAAAACLVLAYGTPRDRKRLLKAMKGHVQAMAANEWGHVVLCMALAVVDDTALLGKTITPELKELLEDGVQDPHVVRVLLQLLAPDCRRHFPPAIHAMLHPPERLIRGSSGKAASGIDGDEDEEEAAAGAFTAAAMEDDGEGDGDDLFQAKGAKKKQRKEQQQQAKGQKAGQQKKPAAEGGAGSDDEGGGAGHDPSQERVLGQSKKDPVTRRREVLGSGPKSLAAALTHVCTAQAGTLIRMAHSCELVVEVARGGEDGLLCELDPAGVATVQEALVAEAQRDPSDMAAGEAEPSGDGEGEEAGPLPAYEHVLLHYFASRALRRLVLTAGDEGAHAAGAPALVQALWEEALAGRCKQYVGSHAEKVLAALLHCGVKPVEGAAAKELKPLIKGQGLEDWAAKFLGQKGAKGGAAGHGSGAPAPAAGKQQQGKHASAAVVAGANAAKAPAAKKAKK